MRLGTWNCRLNLDGKRAALERLALDIAVIPESAGRPRLARRPDVSHTWIGTNPHKGLGVFGFNGWHVTPLTEVAGLPWCLPVSVRNPDGNEFTLLAIWTVKRQGEGRPSYASQFTVVIERWRHLLAESPVVIAGDLNASLQGPQVGPHRQNLAALTAIGTRNAYELVHGPMEPAAQPATLRWIGPGRKQYHFHCDHIFVSAALVSSVRSAEIGTLAEWVESGLSDHCPVVAELDLTSED
jgi:exodeoxyribonuclease-3